MNLQETAVLLALAASFDRRNIGEADVRAWHQVLADVDLDDAKTAVTDHYGQTTDWLMPAHIRTRVKALRAARIDKANLVYEPIGEESAREFCRRLAALRHDAATGDAPARPIALALPAGIAAPPDIVASADAHRVGLKVLQVACPFCKAPIGSPCQLTAGPRGRRPNGGAHPSRKDLAGVSA